MSYDGQNPYNQNNPYGQPGTGNPYGGQPGAGNPYGGQPGAGNPYGGQPGTGNPYGGQPGAGNPYGGQPGAGNPYGGQPGAGNPYGGQPGNMNQGGPYGRPGQGNPGPGRSGNPYDQSGMGNQGYGRSGNPYGQPSGGSYNPSQGVVMNGGRASVEKKSNKTLFIILAVVGVLIVGGIIAVIVAVTRFANKQLPVISSDQFVSACEGEGLTTYVETGDMAPGATGEAYAYNVNGTESDWNVFISYDQFGEEDSARNYYTKYAFDNDSGPSIYSSVNAGNYEYTKGTDGGKFYYTIRVDNMVIVAYSAESNKSMVEGVMKKLGY